MLSCGSVSWVCGGIEVSAAGAVAVSVVCAGVFAAVAGSEGDAASGFISTGAVEGAPWPLAGREPDEGRAAEGVSAGEAMAVRPERCSERRLGPPSEGMGENGCPIQAAEVRRDAAEEYKYRIATLSRAIRRRAAGEGCSGRATGDVGRERIVHPALELERAHCTRLSG